jgi:hypothetical protein
MAGARSSRTQNLQEALTVALFIAVTDGVTNFDQGDDSVEVALSLISKQDTGLGWASATTSIEGVVDCTQVSYVPTLSGPTPNRLNELVNTLGFISPATFIVIFGVDQTYVVDGTPMKGRSISIPPGQAGNPFANHVALFYDMSLCGGAGMWVRKQGGGRVAVTPDVLLYHELSHSFYYVTTGTLGTEVQAKTDENDMRDVRGLHHCKVTSHAGGCGHPLIPCCIIASLSTGSPHSSEVNQFREFREHVLRRSEVGDDFFRTFHYHYYGFSPEVCRLMGHKPTLKALIKDYFVVPLLAGLELLIHYADHKGEGLTDLLRAQEQREDFARIYRLDFRNELKLCLSLARSYDETAISTALLSKGDEFAGVADLMRHVNKQTLTDEFINWALVDVLRIWLASASLLSTEKTSQEINAEIRKLISTWISQLPITPIWEELSRLETENELNGLEQFIFDRDSKEMFCARLIEKHPRYSATIRDWAHN